VLQKLGRAEEEGKEKLGHWTGPCGRKKGEGERLGWARPQGRKERGKRKGESGPGPIRRGGRKRIAFKCI
jgi:hypothetical protein